MESSGPPPCPPPRTLPTPVGNPCGISTATHSHDDEVTDSQEHDKLRSSYRWPTRPPRSTMSPCRRYAPTGWPPSIGMGGRLRRNPHPKVKREVRLSQGSAIDGGEDRD